MQLRAIERAFMKGTRPTATTTVAIDAGGLADDRRFVLIDADGKQLYANNTPRLSQIVVDLCRDGSDRLALRFPDGRVVDDALVHADGGGGLGWDGKMKHGAIVAGPFADALSAYLGVPVRLLDVGGLATRAIDVEPVTILGRQSVENLAGRLDVPGLDHRRFRANLYLDLERPYQEDEWIGDRVRIGAVELDVIGQVPRCVAVTRDPETGDRDADVLGEIATYRERFQRTDGRGKGLPFAVYARVVTGGTVTVGDAVVGPDGCD